MKPPIIAIVGRTNVGKSSIFNTLLERRETIVAKEEGTTRDSITERFSYQGHDLWLVDTAGVKDPEDDFEETIQEQIETAIDSADIIWVVIEANTVITDEDRAVATKALKSKKPIFLLVNKVDKVKKFEPTNYQKLGIKTLVPLSATQGRGFENLLKELLKVIPKAIIKHDDYAIKVAVVGRPNVGKSNLFNALLKKQQALVSARAGTTRDVQRTRIKYKQKEIEIMDTAGIRRSGKIERGVEHFSVLRTLAAIEYSDICFLLMDVKELNVQLDQKITGMVKDAGKGLVLVITKWDSVEEKDPYLFDHIVPGIKMNFDFVPWASIIFTSAVTGQNVTKLFDLAIDITDEREKKISTSALNSWLKEVIGKHPPAGLKNTSPKLNYITQEKDNSTPTFKVFGTHTKLLHWSYKRFLERELRRKFGFSGTAVKFWFFEKHIDRLKDKSS